MGHAFLVGGLGIAIYDADFEHARLLQYVACVSARSINWLGPFDVCWFVAH